MTDTSAMRVREAVSWWIVSEFVRRSRTNSTIIETHPGGGQYDCLAVYEPKQNIERHDPRQVLDINRNGSMHIRRLPDGLVHLRLELEFLASTMLTRVIRTIGKFVGDCDPSRDSCRDRANTYVPSSRCPRMVGRQLKELATDRERQIRLKRRLRRRSIRRDH